MSDQILGALLAAACGDALGAPFEGNPAPAPAVVAGWETAPHPLRWTDDTALTLATAEHLITTGGTVDEDALARTYAAEWSNNPHRRYGAGPPQIFTDLLEGRDWQATAAGLFGGKGSYGNGAAMRVAPVGLLPQLDLPEVAALARQTATVTHCHPLGVEGAAIQAVAVALAARSDPARPLEPGTFLRTITDQLVLPEYRFALQTARTLVLSDCQPGDVAAWLGNGTAAHASVPAAITAFLRNSDDPAAAIRFAILIGGDTDTIAAMTGALAGARRGTAALPPAWCSRLEQADSIRVTAQHLAELAARATPD